jgi:hypothetical protein
MQIPEACIIKSDQPSPEPNTFLTHAVGILSSFWNKKIACCTTKWPCIRFPLFFPTSSMHELSLLLWKAITIWINCWSTLSLFDSWSTTFSYPIIHRTRYWRQVRRKDNIMWEDGEEGLSSHWMTLSKTEDIGWRGSTRSHCLENWQWRGYRPFPRQTTSWTNS